MNIIRIDEQQRQEMIDKGVWHPDCPVSTDLLRRVDVAYLDFEGDTKTGSIVVHMELARCTANIFRELEIRAFPIHSILPMEHFKGDDIRSMEANNTSGFNGRRVAGTERWSSHAFGAAIDINPVQNPFLKIDPDTATISVQPHRGTAYVNRNGEHPGKVEEIVSLMAAFGFTEWGGRWADRPDYHHFQLPWDEIRSLPTD